MKHFNTESLQTKALNDNGAFFAFGDKQFNEQKIEGVKYVSMGCGMIAPKENAPLLFSALESINGQKIEWELANNTKKEIIWYQMANHEVQLNGDYSEVIEMMNEYNITPEEVQKEYSGYFQHCIDNDYF